MTKYEINVNALEDVLNVLKNRVSEDEPLSPLERDAVRALVMVAKDLAEDNDVPLLK